MAERFDVADRLAEGSPAVERTQSYVRACQALGYHDPELTSHPAQIRDWYDGEDGLDLRALDHDCAELRAAEAVVAEALRTQRAQVVRLAAAWAGPGGDAAVELLQRHCDAGNTVAVELRAAAQRCESLRDNLWYLVDAKVATAIAIDDRTRGRRQAWLAAATAIMTGAGDRTDADEVVRQQMMPYVDNDIRSDWLAAMRSTSDGVATAYDMVTERMAAAPALRFEFPGALGPDCVAVQQVPHAEPTLAAAPAPPVELAAPPVTDAPTPGWGSAPGAGVGPPAGDLGGSSGVGGIVGLAGRIVDAMGDLIGSAADEPGGTDSFGEAPFDPDGGRDVSDDKPDTSDKPDKPIETEEVEDTDETRPGADAPPVDGPRPASEPAPPLDVPLRVDAPAPGPPTGTAAPAAGPVPSVQELSTPCEIAADQLPQAGG